MPFVAAGSVGTGTSTTSSTSVALTTTQQVNVGDVLVAWVSGDNAGTTIAASSEISSITDAAGNTWLKAHEYRYSAGAANDGVVSAIFYCNVVNQIANASTITASFAAAKTAKSISVERFTGGVATHLSSYNQATTHASVGANDSYGSLTISGLPSTSVARLFLRSVGQEGSRGLTPTSGFTGITAAITGTGSSNICTRGEYILSTATSVTSAPTSVGGGGDSPDTASVYVVLEEEGVRLTGSGATVSRGSVTPSPEKELSSATTTSLAGSLTGRAFASNTAPYPDTGGFGGGDYSTLTWAGDAQNSNNGHLAGMMGMF